MKDRFGHRSRTLQAQDAIQAHCGTLRAGLSSAALRTALDAIHPADLADAMRTLTDAEDQAVYEGLAPDEAAELLDEVDASTLRRLVALTPPVRLGQILDCLPPDEAADVLGAMPKEGWEAVLTNVRQAESVRELLAYAPDTAGGIMSRGFVAAPVGGSAREALARFRDAEGIEAIFSVFATDEAGRLAGAVDLHTLVRADGGAALAELIDPHVARVPLDADQERVAAIFARYDLNALPVVASDGRLMGVVTADDVIDVVVQEANEDVAHLSGTDAGELEKKTPAKIAFMRMPWLLATMLIELFAGAVVGLFSHTLAQLLILTSFMPVISAISGNTGLQSAAIIIRGLSSGHVQMAHWRHAVARQLSTTLILAGTCGVALGIVGAFWGHHWAFGLLVAVGMFTSMNIAGAVGTMIPLLSKRLGFDPALTAGPFETAFQDVIGISIFLGMATLLMPYLK